MSDIGQKVPDQARFILDFDQKRVVAVSRNQIEIGGIGMFALQRPDDFLRLVGGIQPVGFEGNHQKADGRAFDRRNEVQPGKVEVVERLGDVR